MSALSHQDRGRLLDGLVGKVRDSNGSWDANCPVSGCSGIVHVPVEGVGTPPSCSECGATTAQLLAALNGDSGQAWNLRPMSTVRSRSVRWLWENWIPLGKITTLSGRPKIGKGLLYSRLIADVTRGRLDGDLRGKPHSAVIITTEDDPADTLKPRLEAAGADCDRVHYVGVDGLAEPLRFPQDGPRLGSLIEQVGDVALIVIDPLVEFIDGKVDTHKSQPLRQALASVQPLAAEQTAVLAVVHLNKGASTDVMQRMEGGGAFHQVSRGGMLLGEPPHAPPGGSGRILAASPGNLVRLPLALELDIQTASVPGQDGDAITTANIAWGDPVDGVTADDLLHARTREEDDGESSALDEAKDFLREELADGPQLASSVISSARVCGISNASLKRARAEVGVQPRKTSQRGPWEWSIPRGSSGVEPLGIEPLELLGKSSMFTGDSEVHESQGAQPRNDDPLGVNGGSNDLGESMLAEYAEHKHGGDR